MIKVSVMYPNSSDTKFDIDYYCNKHMPMVKDLLGGALKDSKVDYGLAGGSPEEDAPFVAIGHMMFESVDSFKESFTPHGEKIGADVANFTNTAAQVQISEIKL